MTHDEFFAWMRSQQDDKRLSQDMVDGANELLAFMSPNELKSALMKVNNWQDNTSRVMALSKAGSDMIKQYERFMSAPYRDAVGVWTIGYGNTYYPNRQPVRSADAHLTEPQAAKLKQDIINMDFAPAVNLLFADEIAVGEINQNQFDALLSLSYNIGVKALSNSSVLRHIKAGNMTAAADSFTAWNKGRVNGQLVVLNGLTRRRNEERDLFLA